MRIKAPFRTFGSWCQTWVKLHCCCERTTETYNGPGDAEADLWEGAPAYKAAEPTVCMSCPCDSAHSGPYRGAPRWIPPACPPYYCVCCFSTCMSERRTPRSPCSLACFCKEHRLAEFVCGRRTEKPRLRSRIVNISVWNKHLRVTN